MKNRRNELDSVFVIPKKLYARNFWLTLIECFQVPNIPGKWQIVTNNASNDGSK